MPRRWRGTDPIRTWPAHPDNHASGRLAERLGFTYEGTTRSGHWVGDDVTDGAPVMPWVPGPGTPEPFYRRWGFVPTGEIDDGEIVAALRLD